MDTLKKLEVFGVAVVMLGVLSACMTSQPEETSRFDRTLDTEGNVEEIPVSIRQSEQRIDERPIARGGEIDTPSEVTPGFKLDYYPRKFREMGYNIEDVDRKQDRVTYELKKDEHWYQVTLIVPRGKERVERIEHYHYQLNENPKVSEPASEAQAETSQNTQQ